MSTEVDGILLHTIRSVETVSEMSAWVDVNIIHIERNMVNRESKTAL